MGQRYVVGPRTVSKQGRKVTITLPRDFEFLHGKRVYLTIEVWEPPKPSRAGVKNNAEPDSGED